MKLLVLVPLLLVNVDAFTTSSMTRNSKTTSLHAASQLPLDNNSNRRSPTANPAIREPSKSIATKVVTQRERNAMKDVIIAPDYWLSFNVAMLCPLILWYHPSYYADGSLSLVGVSGALFHVLFATLLLIQTRRVRAVFEKDAFEFYNIKGPQLDFDKGAKLARKPDNYVSGTVNRWKYDSIVNYGFFPSLDYPLIVYFKETETPPSQWNKWFAALDFFNDLGQPHFFPGICNARQFKNEMERRGVKRKVVQLYKKPEVKKN